MGKLWLRDVRWSSSRLFRWLSPGITGIVVGVMVRVFQSEMSAAGVEETQ